MSKNKYHRRTGAIMNRSDIPLEEMQKLGFIIMDKTVICCVDQDNKPVTTKRAIAAGCLDAYTKR